MGDLRRRALLGGGNKDTNDYVDLGLPSGTLWCTGNICKSGSDYYIGNATDYGAYYSWGNIDGHNEGEGYTFSSSTYQSTPGYTLTSDISDSDASHNAALACLGTEYRMPTKSQFEELIANCSSTWVTNYGGTGVNGLVFTSNINNNKIFIPANGYFGSSLSGLNSEGNYWSTMKGSDNKAYLFVFDTEDKIINSQNRRYGLGIRPVIYPCVRFSISTTDGSSREGIAFFLSDGTNTYTYVTDENGEVKVQVPQGTYTVSSTYWTLSINSVTISGQKKVDFTATKIGGGLVDLGLSVLWASGNICKSGNNYYVGNSTDKGCYYSWGNIEGHNEGDGYDFSSSTYQSTPGYTLTGNISGTDASHDAALACLGTGYRMPTKAEFDELISNCDVTWVTSYNGVAVAGRIFKSKKAGYTDAEIFIPASGYYNGTTLRYEGSDGGCWSSAYYGSSDAYYLYFNSSYVDTYDYYRYYGFTVRAVKSK